MTEQETKTAISALIGYLSALEVGTVVTQAYFDRLNNHYIPNIKRLAPKDCKVEP